MGLDGDIFVYFIKEDFFMRTLKITRKITAVMAAVLVAFSICTFAPSNVHAAETLDANVSAQPFKAGRVCKYMESMYQDKVILL